MFIARQLFNDFSLATQWLALFMQSSLVKGGKTCAKKMHEWEHNVDHNTLAAETRQEFFTRFSLQ